MQLNLDRAHSYASRKTAMVKANQLDDDFQWMIASTADNRFVVVVLLREDNANNAFNLASNGYFACRV